MSVVGAFPGLNALKRRTIRGAINPLDKATVVSVYPKEIIEKKCTIQPGIFHIKPGSFDNPSILIVGPSSWWRDIDEEQPLLEIPVSAIVIADSVVKDYCNGIFGCDMAEQMPGLFYVPGAKMDSKGNNLELETLKWIKTEYKSELEKAHARQKNWYMFQVKAADSLWARSNGNPLAISDDMRLAAKELNVTANKDWMKDFQMIDMVRCKACGSLKNPQFPICAACHFPDPDHPMTKQMLELKNSLSPLQAKQP